MRIAAVILFTFATFMSAAKAASVDELFRAFGLYGTWASDCASPAAPINPHVRILMPTPGIVLEQHDLGSLVALNKYSVLSAEKISEMELSVNVIFHPGEPGEERQKLVLRVRDNTRRTMFNQSEGGEVRVKDGIALAHGTRTPLLHKCE